MKKVAQKRNRRRNAFIKQKRNKHTVFSILKRLFLPFVLIVSGAVGGVYLSPVLVAVFNPPIQKVIVNGDFLYLEREEVIKNINIYTDDRLLSVDLAEVQRNLEKMPWVFSAQILRNWPDGITIKVQEQKPIAKWNNDFLLNQYGELFSRQGKVVRGMPELFGYEQGEKEVLQRYLEFSGLLVPYSLQVVSLKQNARGGWFARLNNGVELILGKDNALEKMRRFVILYDAELQFSDKEVEVVDLRYGNGAAVQWKNLDVKVNEVASRE